MQIELSETGDLAHRAAILAPLAVYNAEQTGRRDPGASLAILLRDDAGVVEGGMLGSLWQGWFKLDYAFLPEHRRGARLGARMLSSLETEAVRRGAVGSWMQSFSFQAPGFYERLGYREFARIEDRPPGHYDAFLVKTAGFGRDGAEVPVTTDPTADERKIVQAGIRGYSDGFAPAATRGTLALLVRDVEGAIIGGLWALFGRSWMFVDLLGLPPEARRSGLGRRLIGVAEAQARAKGCIGIYLDTFSFQARPFYEKLGYTVFGEIDDYPAGHKRYFLSKRLDA